MLLEGRKANENAAEFFGEMIILILAVLKLKDLSCYQ